MNTTCLNYCAVLFAVICAVLALSRRPLTSAIRSAIKAGSGLMLILVLDQFFTSQVQQALSALQNKGIGHFTAVELGGSSCVALGMVSVIGLAIIPLCCFVNWLLYRMHLTDCINIDIFNLHQNAAMGVIIWSFSGSLTSGFLAAILLHVWALIMADAGAKRTQHYFNLEEHVTITHPIANSYLPLAYPIDWLLEHIPFVRRISFDTAKIQHRMGLLGESMMVGFLEGFLLGLAAWGASGLVQSVGLGLCVAAAMYLIPKAASLYTEGLHHIAGVVKKHMLVKDASRHMLVGLDASLAVGDTGVSSVALLLVPTMVLLSVILPGNTVLPMLDLLNVCFYIACMLPVFRGNVFRTWVGSTLCLGSGLWIASYLAPATTLAYEKLGVTSLPGLFITDFDPAGTPFAFLFAVASKMGLPGLLLMALGMLALAQILMRKRRGKQKIENAGRGPK